MVGTTLVEYGPVDPSGTYTLNGQPSGPSGRPLYVKDESIWSDENRKLHLLSDKNNDWVIADENACSPNGISSPTKAYTITKTSVRALAACPGDLGPVWRQEYAGDSAARVQTPMQTIRVECV
jgi:hypothetical protein